MKFQTLQPFFARHFREILAALAGIALWIAQGSPVGVVLFPLFVVLARHLRKLRKARVRHTALRTTLPYYLDLLTLALEAGLDLVAAMEEITTRDSPNPLREEFLGTLRSIRTGTARSAAFAELEARTNQEEIRLFTIAVTQAEELGSSLAGILRLQAEALRKKLFFEAEARAQKAPLKMLFPLLFLVFPATMLILFFPLLWRLMALQ